MEKEELLKKIIQRDGIKDILIHNSEEAGEYLSAVSHCKRGKCNSQELAKEIADLRIMVKELEDKYDKKISDLVKALSKSFINGKSEFDFDWANNSKVEKINKNDIRNTS